MSGVDNKPTLPSSNERFNNVPKVEISSEITAEITVETEHPWNWVCIRDTDPNGPTFLDIEQAVMLRDWFNKAIPTETPQKASNEISSKQLLEQWASVIATEVLNIVPRGKSLEFDDVGAAALSEAIVWAIETHADSTILSRALKGLANETPVEPTAAMIQQGIWAWQREERSTADDVRAIYMAMRRMEGRQFSVETSPKPSDSAEFRSGFLTAVDLWEQSCVSSLRERARNYRTAEKAPPECTCGAPGGCGIHP